MQLKEYFKKELVFYDLSVADKGEFFTILSQKACSLGKVTDEFEVNVKKREDNFPTGIQLEDFAVAIPHTDAEYVKEEFIAVAVFKEPVKFSSMEDASAILDVRAAFMLGLNQPHSQLEVLTELMGIFQDKETMAKIINSSSKEELENIIFNI
ncbi:PTS sugar transporter subunit IIA [Peptostreptococcus anaerobius]|uniref:PTS sugar transporter subunit IIA n=1 Tax=Peptostreptococcus anaerobius TaxID=1261 RepID=UPI003218F162